MFEYDICLCGNPEKCPLKDICLRNQHRVGINTYSLFYAENQNCEYFIAKNKEDRKKVQRDA